MIAFAQTKVDTLTNDKVILLVKAGFQSSVIVTKIKTSITKFDITTDGLIKLSENGIPKEVLNVMINPEYIENDSISLCKKWKQDSYSKNGVFFQRNGDYFIQFFNDGVYRTLYVDYKTGKQTNQEMKFEWSKDGKNITFYSEGKIHISEIVKLTDKELETKSILADGTEMRFFYAVVKE